MSIYYVYAYLREDSTPYYIGKGKGGRAYDNSDHIKHGIYLPEDRNRIVILYTNLDDERALEIEASLIKQYGRKDLGTGILHNKTDGGPNPVLYGEQNGMTRKSHTEETRQRIRETKVGKPRLNDKLIHCECCDNLFKPQAFFKHCDTNHPESIQANRLRPYKCIHCSTLFTTAKNLSTHIRHKHPNQDAYVSINPL